MLWVRPAQGRRAGAAGARGARRRLKGNTARGDRGHLVLRERVAPQSEVIRAILSEDSPRCGGPHQVGAGLPDIALLNKTFWIPAMAVQAVLASGAVFSKVKPTQSSWLEQRASAAATVMFPLPASFPWLMKPLSTANPWPLPGSMSVSVCFVPGRTCCVASAQ